MSKYILIHTNCHNIHKLSQYMLIYANRHKLKPSNTWYYIDTNKISINPSHNSIIAKLTTYKIHHNYNHTYSSSSPSSDPSSPCILPCSAKYAAICSSSCCANAPLLRQSLISAICCFSRAISSSACDLLYAVWATMAWKLANNY